jgi:predicted enzyme related to lactoylglutathione lyase
MTTPLQIGRIMQLAVNVQDLPRATAFYRDILGLPLLFEVPAIAFFDCGGVRLMLAKAEKPELDHPSSIIYFQVDDIQAAFQALQERSVTVVSNPSLIARMEDREVWIAAFRDSEENLLALMSEPPLAQRDS